MSGSVSRPALLALSVLQSCSHPQHPALILTREGGTSRAGCGTQHPRGDRGRERCARAPCGVASGAGQQPDSIPATRFRLQGHRTCAGSGTEFSAQSRTFTINSDFGILLGELPSEQRLEALPQAMCLLLDTVCMIAYRAEAALANVIAPAPCCGRCSPVAPRTSRSSRYWHASTKPRPPYPTRISGSSTSYCPTWNSLPPAETASRPPNLFHTVSARCKEF